MEYVEDEERRADTSGLDHLRVLHLIKHFGLRVAVDDFSPGWAQERWVYSY